MSRHPVEPKNSEKYAETTNLAEEYLNFVAEQSILTAMTLEEVRQPSSEDKTNQKAVEFTRSGRWFEIKQINDPDINSEKCER